MEFLFYVAVALFVIWTFRLVLTFLVGEQDYEDEDESSPAPIFAQMERIGDIVYAYTPDGEFLGQGTTREELYSAIKANVNGRFSVYGKAEDVNKVGL